MTIEIKNDGIEIKAVSTMDKREYDTNGWFEVKDNPISKVGVFPYLGSQIDKTADPGKIYNVFRPADELGSEECINSFRLQPWIDNHVMLGSEDIGLTPAEQKGIHGVIGEQIYLDGDTLKANLKCFSESLANLIQSGKKELSCGYRCTYEKTSGTYKGQAYDYVQRELRGNHIALVDSGRMGSAVSVQDESIINKKGLDMSEKDKNTEVEVPAAGAEGEEAKGEKVSIDEAHEFFKENMPKIKKMFDMFNLGSEKKPEVETEDDDKDEDKDEDEEKKSGEGMDTADIVRRVETSINEKAAFYSTVSKHIGAFDHSDMTIEKMASYAADKLEIKAPKGGQVAYVSAYLAGRGESKVVASMDTHIKGSNFVSKYLKGNK